MLRDVFYYGKKPNVHPREQYAENLNDARLKATTRDFWIINEFCDYRNFDWDFDFEFLPDEDVWAEDHNNVWPSQHQKDSGTWLCPKNHSDIIIYRNDVNPVIRKNEHNENWVELDLIDHSKFDFSWHPDPTDPPYIYKWGCKYFPAEFKHVLEYHVPGATQEKYMNITVELLPETDRWVEYQRVDKEHFDLAWRPSPLDPPFIYVWGNKYIDGKVMPTIEYHMSGATDKKHMPELAPVLPEMDNWEILEAIDMSTFDFAWRPDPTSPPYIYAWGNQWNAPEDKISVQYVVPGATDYKYMEERATRKPCMDNWFIPHKIMTDDFDLSWEPSPAAPPYIYEFATQWQKTGGPQYRVPGATEKQYVDFQKGKKLPAIEAWSIPDNIDIAGFDFSWHPDDTSPPYVYVFATQWAFSGGPIYTVPGATEIKYVDDQIATAKVDMTNWVYDPSLIDTTSFDFSWHPYVEDQPYIYEFGTQWQKTGGPKYITPGADSSSPTKYIDTRILKAKRLPNPTDSNWKILNEYKIKDFDFSWHPDSTEEPYIYVFGNNLYPAEEMPTIEYHVPNAKQVKFVNDVIAVLDQDLTNWEIPDDVDTTGFDFSWKPNPTDPAYIYEFGTQHQKTGGPRYVVPGATETKYLDFQTVTRKAVRNDNWKVIDSIDVTKFDFSWHPDATDPAYIYAWGNQWVSAEDRPSIEYVVPGATEYRYMDNSATRLPIKDSWIIPDDIDCSEFDFSWEPSPKEEPYIYQFGTQWQKTGGPKFIVDGATEVKYVDTFTATKIKDESKFTVANGYKIKDFDYSWHPDDTEEPYIYVFGNNLYPAEECSTIEYRVEGATEVKYVNDIIATLDSNVDNWIIPDNIDTTNFDFSWVPNPTDPAYIYEFGTQHQKTGGPKFIVDGATEIKYLDFQRVTHKVNKDMWIIPDNIDVTDFDFSWHPDNTDPAYIYQFGTQWALSGGPRYVVDGATEIKYMDNLVAKALPNRDNWVYDETKIDVESFDFSWHPYVEDQPYIYEFGTQHQKTGGPKYITPGADSSSPTKYIDTRILKSKRLPNPTAGNWQIFYKIKDFDFSWHPDDTEEPYIYVFGNNLYPAEECPTVKYVVEGATQVKYIQNIVATLDTDMTNWVVPEKIDTTGFDFSWVPNPYDGDYIYQFGTQWQKTGGPRYVVPGATEIKYVDHSKVVALSNTDNWEVPDHVDVTGFDFSWHPDDTDPAYIYQFGTQWALSGGPRYIVPGATEIKYMDNPVAKALPDRTNWIFNENEIDVDSFDFSWHPYVEDQPYIYQFGTQHQKTGGPKYITPGADSSSPTKYIDTRILRASRLPNKADSHWNPLYDIADFDYSWHPDDTEEPFIYIFGNTQYSAEDMPTIEYCMPNAKQVKYVHGVSATLAPCRDNWVIHTAIDEEQFDFSWRPHPKDPAYIYRWGNKYVSNKYEPTIEYVVPGATEIKYMDDNVVVLPETDRWSIPKNIDVSDFDFTWRPDPLEPPQIYQFGTQWQKTNGPTYTYPGATVVKYMDTQKAKFLPTQKNWDIPVNVDVTDFDFSWHPDDTSPPYIYQFPTQWALSGGPRYVVPGATQTKYVETDTPAKVLPSKANWEYDSSLIDEDAFDFSWHPYAEDQPYIYQFGTQHQKTGGPRYIAPGATSNSPVKYVDTRIIKSTRLPNKKNWVAVNDLVIEDFDYSWHPDETETPYIYVFGNTQYGAEDMPTIQYVVDGATEIKYVHDVVAKLGKNMTNWEVPSNIDTNDFDFGWVPHPKSPPYIYEFATVWNNRGGPRYIVPGATEFKYVDDIKAKLVPSKDNWEIDEGVDVKLFDFSWVPHPEAPPYIYQFGTILDKNDGPRYITPGNEGEIVYRERVEIEETAELPVYRYFIETTLEDLINEHPDEIFWAIRKSINYDDFDFGWRPNIEQAQYVHAFGSADSELTQTYFVNASQWLKGNREFNWVENVELTEEALVELFVKPDMFYVDRGNIEANNRFEALKAKFGTRIQKTRYLNSWVDTISRCSNRATSDVFWVLNSELDYTDFNFDYYPNPWQMKMVHVFGTQWSHWGTTFMVNRESFREDTKYIKIIEHLSNLNFVKDIRAKATKCVHDIVVVDHGNKETQSVVDLLQSKAPDRTITVVKYDTGYLETLKDIVKRQQEKKEHFIWVCSSVCDYSTFDFTYICDPFARDNLHVFPSGKQKFGDTFFIDVNNAKEVIKELDSLEDFNKVNYNGTVKANRLPEPVIVVSADTHINAFEKITDFPYATLITSDNADVAPVDVEPMNLWSNETKNIYITSTGATRIVVPKEIKDHVEKELYEYPYIKRAPKLALSKPLDIVFVSNGEIVADQNYEHLEKTTNGLKNKIHRIDGINGRTEALHAAAEASETPWFFCVPAKLFVNKKFDWNYQADRLQMPKHYIFNAYNPVNDLFYGHQSMVLYNKNLVLGNHGVGLDFTLDSPHMSVELNSGTVVGDTDEYSTWRTAFREAVKLKKYSENGDDNARKRLAVWTSVGKGNYGEWSIKGALDGIEFYNEVDGELAKLRQSYYWDWLKTRFDSKY